MNLLFVDQFSEMGGGQLCLQDLLPGVVERGWNPRLMLPEDGAMWDYARAQGIAVDPLPIQPYTNGRKTLRDLLSFSLDLPRAAAAIRDAVGRHSIDLLYVNGPRVLPAATGVSCPLVFHAHSHLDKRYTRGLVAWSVRRAGAMVIAVSCYAAASLTSSLPMDTVQVIYSGVADLGGRPRRRASAEFRIGMIGRIAPEKGLLDFVDAARRIAVNRQDVRFVIYGSERFSTGNYECLVRDSAQGLPIEFCGWTDDVRSAFHDLDMVVVPSRARDAAPRVVMEALSAGTPVVAYPSGGIPELIEHGVSGLLTDAATVPALVRSIEYLLERPELIEYLSKTGREQWEKRFTLDRYRREVCDLLAQFVAAPTTTGLR
jgi:glycosyltransferase involved in cell wall biosynthesis